MADGTHASISSSEYQWMLLARCYDTKNYVLVAAASVCLSVASVKQRRPTVAQSTLSQPNASCEHSNQS
jgi:hypothetical protein